MVHAYTFVVRVCYCPSFVSWFCVTWLHLNVFVNVLKHFKYIYTKLCCTVMDIHISFVVIDNCAFSMLH